MQQFYGASALTNAQTHVMPKGTKPSVAVQQCADEPARKRGKATRNGAVPSKLQRQVTCA